ncbi:MAG: bacteriohopanetetrol glucosamine biosynthesis glycosyltransferase HpnI [Caulobacterales bacterium]|jgi:ceramide glucosyltransferase
MHHFEGLALTLCWAISIGSGAYLALAIGSLLTHRFDRNAAPAFTCSTTVLKPLCGDEPDLEMALESFVTQQTLGPVRYVFGVADARDAALPVVRALAAKWPQTAIDVVIDARVHGANPKVSNLINMAGARAGVDEVVVIADSDVVIPPGALQTLLNEFSLPDVGAATCLYRGRPSRPGWASILGALYLDGWFLPTAILHGRLSSPQVCYGPMTALRRDVLQGAGGLPILADSLADDTELGHLTRRQGLRIAIAPVIAETLVDESRIGDLFAHELRWAKMIRALQPLGYPAMVFTHPGPIPLIMVCLDPGAATGVAALSLVALRWALVHLAHRRFGRSQGVPAAGPILLWLREQLYFCVWVAGFFGDRITWRGREFRIGRGATLQRPSLASQRDVGWNEA